jgi:Tol biopolymer transport system component
MHPSVGTKLGPYEILAPIGAGGMGEVYRARDTKLDRDVAIKILPAAFASDAGRMARFEREAKVLASLNHPNIAHIYGVEDRALVMELVEGESPKGPLPFEDAWKIALQIGDALEYAHEKGVIHRDLKPANVKVTPEGVVKLLDFGLAKAFSEAPESLSSDPANSPTITLGATVAGTILGTAAYMAPEQAKGKRVDKRADIWSWGVVLYELLTGERSFEGDDAADTLAHVLTKQPNLDRVPPQVRKLLGRCLEKDPKNRLRDIGVAKELLEEQPREVAPLRTWHGIGGWIAAAVLAIALAVTGVALWRATRTRLPAVTRFQIFAPPGGTLPLGVPAPSPDGRMVVYTVREHDGLVRLYVRSLDSTESRALPGTEYAVHPFWSPDGRSVGFASTNNMQIKRVDLDAGSARSLASATGPWHGSWSQAGTILFQAGGGLAQIPAEGGSAAPVWKLDDKKGDVSAGFPFFLSDGKRFLVSVRHNDGGDIELGSLGSTNRTMVLPNATSAAILAPTPDGKSYLLYLRDATLMAQEFDEKAGTVRGNPFLLVDVIGRVAATGAHPSVGVSPSGVLAYQAGGVDTNLMRLGWYDRSGKLLEELPPQTEGVDLQLSPDGRSLAVARGSSATAIDIWLADLTRGSSTRFTFGSASKIYSTPVWSPDGKRVAYGVVGSNAFYVKDASGTGAEQELVHSAGAPMSWSPDGRQILFWSPAGALFLATLGAKAPVLAGPASGVSASGAEISPDGNYFVFSSAESGREEVYVEAMPPGAGKWQISINGGEQPRWRKDGKELFFLSPEYKIMAADIQAGQSIAAGVPRVLFQSVAAGIGRRIYAVSSDGQRFLVASPTSNGVDAPITVVLNWWAGLKK